MTEKNSVYDHLDWEKTSTTLSGLEQGYFKENGYVVIYLPPSEPGDIAFAYTYGLSLKGLPELCISGLAENKAVPLLSSLANQAVCGSPMVINDYLQFIHLNKKPYGFILVDDPILERLIQIRAMPFIKAVQIVISDGQGKLPWEPGYSKGMAEFQQVLSGSHG